MHTDFAGSLTSAFLSPYKMSSNLMPYNFTITDKSPLFQYSPFQDGPISTGWNVSYHIGKSEILRPFIVNFVANLNIFCIMNAANNYNRKPTNGRARTNYR